MAEPKVSPDGIRTAYWTEINTRIVDSCLRIDELQDAVAAGRTIPEDEHLVIGAGRQLRLAVMFIDICDFSGRPSANFQEHRNVLTALNLFMSEMVRIATDYGGEVEKNTGDGLMMYFDGDKDEGEQGICKRALASALTMLAVTRHFINPVLVGAEFPEIQFRVGIDFGQVTVARLGVPRIFNSRVAIGSVPNMASKMLGFGGSSEVVIGQNFKEKLPLSWAILSTPISEPSGFVFVHSGAPYTFYKYTGRWTKLV